MSEVKFDEIITQDLVGVTDVVHFTPCEFNACAYCCFRKDNGGDIECAFSRSDDGMPEAPCMSTQRDDGRDGYFERRD